MSFGGQNSLSKERGFSKCVYLVAILLFLIAIFLCVFRNISTLRLFLFVREVKNHLNYEHRVFNSEEFLKTRAAGDQQFYKQVGAVGLVHVGVHSLPFSIFKTFQNECFQHLFLFY